ncbi:MAG TPA: RagB/SusD family nutrient uptake outer membrane protein [Cyclobacteriaceae bacterium]|nr:RagB/SusD family nutrient uptake outer membrane protein [Cyclobacteriaceae bacterium]
MKVKVFAIVVILLIVSLSSCREFLEIDTPKTQIVRHKVFENSEGARAAVFGILSQMSMGGFGGISSSVTVMGGLSSDEFLNHSTSQNNVTLYSNSLTPINNSVVTTNWNDMYLIVYEANSILEGCESSGGLSTNVRSQVVGEAKFIRAFSYFYLINLFGDVPLVTGTDYSINKSLSRAAVSDVYNQIEKDLKESQTLLLSDYSMSGDEKVEPNKWAATALLARAYLYQEKCADAESQSTLIINSNVFSLESNLNSVFLKNSKEAIWQLMPVSPGVNTNEGEIMIIASNPTRWSLSTSVSGGFEVNDKRSASWTGSFTISGKQYRYPFKYKVRLRNQPVTEYYMVLRFAEQYLIRAEARAMQNNLPGAVSDLNTIRTRAGLPLIDATGLTQTDVLGLVTKERRSELFAEFGHRWFDLKRSGTIDAVLGPLKADWQPKDALFPIPQAEITANPNIIQNP